MKSFKTFLEESQTFVSGGFNIARSEMPQLDDSESFIDFVEKSGSIVLNTDLDVDLLKPTQIEFDQDKVDKMIGKKLGSIIVSDDMFVLDGHHRYFAAKQNDDLTINVYIVNMNINKLLKLAYDFIERKNDG